VCRHGKARSERSGDEAAFAYEFIRRKGSFAYAPIIATGTNSCVLHYNTNDQVNAGRETRVAGFAAGYGGYMSDLTRTLPVRGKIHATPAGNLRGSFAGFRKIVRRCVRGFFFVISASKLSN